MTRLHVEVEGTVIAGNSEGGLLQCNIQGAQKEQFGFTKLEILQLCENEGVTVDLTNFFLGCDSIAKPAHVLSCIKELKSGKIETATIFKPQIALEEIAYAFNCTGLDRREQLLLLIDLMD